MAQLAMLGGIGGGGMMSLVMPMFASVVGMFLQPKKTDAQAGKLNDLKVSTSAYGQGIAIVYGTMRVPGNMFWATEFEEVKRYMNSKGKDITGKKKDSKKGQPVYEYYANFAMGLCEGPTGEVLRIWADSNLIYDKYNPDNADLVGPGFSQADTSGSKTGKGAGTGKKGGSQESGRFSFRFYNGGEGQLPDPHMQQKNQEFNTVQTSGHRGLCYLYFEHFALSDFGNRTPTITAEVASEHFRKPTFSYFTQMQEYLPPGDVPFVTTDPFSMMFFDPIRYRAYTVSNDGALRVWDLTTKKEIDRVMISDIRGDKTIQVEHPNYPPQDDYYKGQTLLFNGVGGVNYPTSGHDTVAGAVLGIAASGDLVVRLVGSNNSTPLGFVDVNTWQIKTRFGRFGNTLGDTDITIENPVRSTVLSDYDPVLKVPFYYTVVQSTFGDMYFFNDENEPMSYFTYGGTIYAPGGAGLSPGIPGSGGSSYYTTSPLPIFGIPAASISRFDYISSNLAKFAYKNPYRILGNQVQEDHLQVTPKAFTEVYRSVPEDDEFERSMSLPYPIIGSEAIGFLEYVQGNTVHPEKNGTWAVKMDYAPDRHGVYELKWRAKVDDVAGLGGVNDCVDTVILSGHRLIVRRNDTLVWDINFTLEDIDMWYLPADCPPWNPTQFYFPTKGCIYQEENTVPAEHGGGTTIIEAFLDKMIQTKVTPAEVLRDLADRVGIGQDRVDTTKLNDDEITGYVVQQPKSARNVADDLMKVFFFDITESDYTLKAVSRNVSTVAIEIMQPDLGYIQGDTQADNPGDFYKETRVQEIDLPQTVSVSYIDAKDDYNAGSQHWRRPRSPMPVMQSREMLDINVPMAMEADFAKQTAQKIVYSAWAERTNYEFALPWKYIIYDPTDVLKFTMDDGLQFQARMSSMDLGQDFSIAAQGVATEMASYTSTITSQGNGHVVPVPRVVSPHVRGVVLDIPYFEDTDSVGDVGFNYYWGFRAYGPGFRFGAMSNKVLPNGEWNNIGTLPFDSVWGTVKGLVPLPAWGPGYTDDINSITVMPAFDFDLNDGMFEWLSIADANWPSHENTIVIGGEIIYFKNVTANGDGSYTLDTLIRGARGTEDACYKHRPNDSFTMRSSGLDAELENFANVNRDFLFRPSAPAMLPAGLPSIETILTGASHKPWAPNMAKRANSGANIVLSWERQSRLNGTLRDGTGTVPNVEGMEQYDVFLLTAPYDHLTFNPDDATTYKRKFANVSTNTVTYVAADMATDGNTQASTLYVVVMQWNVYSGRGFPGWSTLFA